MRGGKRPGAGRKRGSLSKKTTEIAQRVIAEGITPLEVLISSMRAALIEGDRDKACQWADRAAPYVHPRLAAVEHSGNADNPLAFEVVSGVTRISDMMDDADTDGAEQTTH